MSCDKDNSRDSGVLGSDQYSEIITQTIRDSCWTDNQKYANARFFWDITSSTGRDYEPDEIKNYAYLQVTKYFDTPIGSLAYPECPDGMSDEPGRCGSNDCQTTFPDHYEFKVEHPFGLGYDSSDYQLTNPRPSGNNDGVLSDYSEGIDTLVLLLGTRHPYGAAAIGIGNFLANNFYEDPVTFSGDPSPSSDTRQEFYWDIEADTSKWPTEICDTVGVELEVENNRASGNELPFNVSTRTTALIPAYTTSGSSDEFEDGICPCEDDVIQVLYSTVMQSKNISLVSTDQ